MTSEGKNPRRNRIICLDRLDKRKFAGQKFRSSTIRGIIALTDQGLCFSLGLHYGPLEALFLLVKVLSLASSFRPVWLFRDVAKKFSQAESFSVDSDRPKTKTRSINFYCIKVVTIKQSPKRKLHIDELQIFKYLHFTRVTSNN